MSGSREVRTMSSCHQRESEQSTDGLSHRDNEDTSKTQGTTISFTPINAVPESFRPRFIPLRSYTLGPDASQLDNSHADFDMSELETDQESELEPELEPELRYEPGLQPPLKRKGSTSDIPKAKRHTGAQDRSRAPEFEKEAADSGIFSTGQGIQVNYRLSSMSRTKIPVENRSQVTSQTTLLSNIPIQKATLRLPGSIKEVHRPTTASLHCGFITTEDRVKSLSSKVSQTTLAKLACFRYREVPSQPAENETSSRQTITPHVRGQEPALFGLEKSPMQNQINCDSHPNDEFENDLDDEDFLALASQVEAYLPPSEQPPLEDEDAEEMHDLQPFSGRRIEIFEPHSSADCYSPADPHDRNFYDISLQCSRPNTILTASISNGSRTSISSELLGGIDISQLNIPTSDSIDDQDEALWRSPRELLQNFSGQKNATYQDSSHLHNSPGLSNYSSHEAIGSDFDLPPSFQLPNDRGSSALSSGQLLPPWINADEAHLYLPMKPFVRPPFPSKVRDRSPIPGLTSALVFRTCFRIGEAIRAAGICDAEKQDALLEVYGRLIVSNREGGTSKQYFQFRDLFFNKPPFLSGLLDNYKSGELVNAESAAFLGREGQGKMVRAMGRMKRDMKTKDWTLEIMNVRETDWEEIRHTLRVLTEGWVKEQAPKRII